MVSSKKVDSLPLASQQEAIHQHLHTQFEGLVIKFTQEIDEIIYTRVELRDELESLTQQLNKACKQFELSKKECAKAIAEFCKECNQAIEAYKKVPQGYSALTRNGVACETMDNIVARFTNSIGSAISYTCEYSNLNSENSELSTTLFILETIKAKFVSAKSQLSAIRDKKEEKEDYSTKQNPSSPS